MGLEAALGLLERGFEATVVEKGRVGDSLRRWGPSTRFFSPLQANLSARARASAGVFASGTGNWMIVCPSTPRRPAAFASLAISSSK